jgi:hypothetical protein
LKGPRDDMPSLSKYAKLLADGAKIDDIILGIIEGETRVIAAS